jgi:hypothetical protein
MSKKKILWFTVLLFVLGITTTAIYAQSEVGSSTSSTPYITAYKDEGFHGESEKFLIGKYSTLEKGWQDEIQSVAIVGPVRVTLFDDEQFEGKKVVLEHSTAKLHDMRGEAKSMIVEEFKCSYATTFKETMFEGDSKQFQVGEYADVSDDWESLDVCAGIEVTLYDKKDFQGESVTHRSSRIDLGKFRKKVKSMKVAESTM